MLSGAPISINCQSIGRVIMYIYLNGKFIKEESSAIAYNDRGLLLADGLFETLRVYDGSVFCLDQHYERLLSGCNVLGLPFLLTRQTLSAVLQELLEYNALMDKNAVIRLTLTRGPGPRGLVPPEEICPTVLITALPLLSNAPFPLKLHVSHIRRNEFSPLSNLKSLCYLDNILAKMDAIKNGADDGLILNTSGKVVCVSAGNIFFVNRENVVLTPPIKDGVLPGVTRGVVIAICKKNNMILHECSLTLEEALFCQEVFVTNSLVEIQSVMSINNTIINRVEMGGVTKIIKKLYREYPHKKS